MLKSGRRSCVAEPKLFPTIELAFKDVFLANFDSDSFRTLSQRFYFLVKFLCFCLFVRLITCVYMAVGLLLDFVRQVTEPPPPFN